MTFLQAELFDQPAQLLSHLALADQHQAGLRALLHHDRQGADQIVGAFARDQRPGVEDDWLAVLHGCGREALDIDPVGHDLDAVGRHAQVSGGLSPNAGPAPGRRG